MDVAYREADGSMNLKPCHHMAELTAYMRERGLSQWGVAACQCPCGNYWLTGGWDIAEDGVTVVPATPMLAHKEIMIELIQKLCKDWKVYCLPDGDEEEDDGPTHLKAKILPPGLRPEFWPGSV